MGRATDLLQVPTRFLMARSARRRKLVFAIVGAVLAAAAVGTAGAFFALDSAKVGSLHREWATFQGCMLGETLKPGESPAQRYRLELLAHLGTPVEKRTLGNGKAWPASCLSSLAVVNESAHAAPSGGEELAKTSAAVAKALATGSVAESSHSLDDLWKAAAAARLADAPSPTNASTPKPATPLYPRGVFEPLARPFGDVALAAIRWGHSPSARVRFVIDDRSAQVGPALCEDEHGPSASLHCKALGPDVARLSPGVRLLGTVDDGASPLLTAGERATGGVFRDLTSPVPNAMPVLGGAALAGDRVRVLTKREGGIVLVEQGPKERRSEVPFRALTDGALAGSYLVSRSASARLVIQRTGATEAGDSATTAGAKPTPVEIGDFPEALATGHDPDERAAFCRAAGTEVIRVRGVESDYVTLSTGGAWSAPKKLGRSDQLSCAEGVAVLATTTHTDSNGRVHATVRVDRCTANDCRETRLSHYDLVGGVPELLPTSRAAFAATVAGGRLFVAWFTSLGDLRVRTGTIDDIASAPEVIVYEGPDTAEAAHTEEVMLVPSTQGAVLLARTPDGVRVFSFGADGTLASAATSF